LTGYVLQGLLAGALFHGWGLGLFGALGHAELLAAALLIWATALLLATAWRKHRDQGPLDAALRGLVRLLSGASSRPPSGS
jgi:uncharacterized protein